ncbi:MAG: MurT ligase domain-containing protein [Patescibacteria group bacterium]
MSLPFFDRSAVILGKFVSIISRWFNLGAGATWPGEITLMLRPQIASKLAFQLCKGAIFVAGTNGKTTTSLMIKKILESSELRVVHNASGANLLNGIVSAFINQASWRGRVSADWGIFEVDENSLPRILTEFKVQSSKFKVIVVLLNLFRDQLDRYGEVDVIIEKWGKALKTLPKETTVILNSDDPGVAHLGKNLKSRVSYFGLNDKNLFLKGVEHATDSTFCLNCGNRLTYEGVYYSHIGIWCCERCGEKRPNPTLSSWQSPLPGLYNQYNTLAAALTAIALGLSREAIKKAFQGFLPAFGRQEEFSVAGRGVKLFLSKNPAGFNASLRTILEEEAQTLLVVLNDRIPDGRDVSWIWDVDFEMVPRGTKIFVCGDRVYDMALRLKYAQATDDLIIEPDLAKAVSLAVETTPKSKTLFILPTYSAMLEVRKILIGRKIL